MSIHKVTSSHQGQGQRHSERPSSTGNAKQEKEAKMPGTTPATGTATPSGRAAFDSRGNAVWEWQTEEDGKFSTDVSTQRVKKLEAPDLSLEETAMVKRPKFSGQGDKSAGFNPYDRGVASGAKEAQDTPARKPIKDLKRYNEWMKMKKRLEEQKDEEK